MSYRVEFCGVAIYPLDLSPKEACGKPLPCEDHPVIVVGDQIKCDVCGNVYNARTGLYGYTCTKCGSGVRV